MESNSKNDCGKSASSFLSCPLDFVHKINLFFFSQEDYDYLRAQSSLGCGCLPRYVQPTVLVWQWLLSSDDEHVEKYPKEDKHTNATPTTHHSQIYNIFNISCYYLFSTLHFLLDERMTHNYACVKHYRWTQAEYGAHSSHHVVQSMFLQYNVYTTLRSNIQEYYKHPLIHNSCNYLM